MTVDASSTAARSSAFRHAPADLESQGAAQQQRLVPAAPPPTTDFPANGGCIPCCCYRRRIGNVYVLWEKPPAADGTLAIRCLAPVCWPMVFVSLGLVSAGAGLVFRFTLPQLPWLASAGSLGLLGLFAAALLLTSLRDFGIFPRYHAPLGPRWNWSLQSQSFRPPGVVFCSESKVLVQGLDHFCPWTGTTIGSGNLLSFYVLLASFWAIVVDCVLLLVYVLNFVDKS